MAAVNAFQSHFRDLVSGVGTCVMSIADYCRQSFILGKDTWDKLVQENAANDSKARILLSEIFSHIQVQAAKDIKVKPEDCVFTKFVGILKREPSLEQMALNLEEAQSDFEKGAQLEPCTDDIEDQKVPFSVFEDSGVVNSESVAPDLVDYSVPSDGHGVEPTQHPTQTIGSVRLATFEGISTAESYTGAGSAAIILSSNGSQNYLSSLLEKKDNEIQDLTKKLNETTIQKEATEQKLIKVQQELENLQSCKHSETDGLHRQIKQLEENLAIKDQETIEMKKEHEVEIDKLKDELDKKKKKYEAKKCKLTEEICSLKVKVALHEKDIEILKGEKKEALCQLTEAKLENETIKRKAAEKEAAMAEERRKAEVAMVEERRKAEVAKAEEKQKSLEEKVKLLEERLRESTIT